jgi:glycosyltransferase involved in cell wall biosynthesis
VSTKKDLLELGVLENIIRVIPEAPTLARSSDQVVTAVKAKYNIKGDYLVAIGITRLKNTLNIIKAFHLARSGKDVKLILIGRSVGLNLVGERNVRVLGFVPQNDLSALMTGSRGLVFASLYEGFGIPILDAMSCGVPVVTSNLGSMKEISGDAACLVDPNSTSSISEGIEKILRGPKSYIDKGLKHVQMFSWEKTAKMTLDVYRESSNTV